MIAGMYTPLAVGRALLASRLPTLIYACTSRVFAAPPKGAGTLPWGPGGPKSATDLSPPRCSGPRWPPGASAHRSRRSLWTGRWDEKVGKKSYASEYPHLPICARRDGNVAKGRIGHLTNSPPTPRVEALGCIPVALEPMFLDLLRCGSPPSLRALRWRRKLSRNALRRHPPPALRRLHALPLRFDALRNTRNT